MNMKLMEYLQDRPTVFLALVITFVSICVIIMIIIILFRLEHEKKVTKAAMELTKITNSVHAGLVHFMLEDNCRILYASKGFYDLLGYKKGEAKSQNKVSLLDFIHPRDQALFVDTKGRMTAKNISCEVRLLTKNGRSLFALMNGNGSVGKDGKHTISVVFVDISVQKRMQETILLEGERYRIATELSKDVLFEYHIAKDEMIHTDKFRELFGTDPMIEHFYSNCNKRKELIHPDDWGIYLEMCQELHEGKGIVEAEFRIKDKVGAYIWCQTMGKTIYNDEKNPIRVIGKIVNIDIQKRELEALEYKATRDPLTGIYNKEVTIKKIDKYLSGNKNSQHMLMFIDLDDFKKVNDTYGHLRGDKVLIYVTGRIKELFSEGEIIGRIGGDEFVVFIGNIDQVEDVTKKAQDLRSALETIYVDMENAIPISGSIGIAISPEDGIHYEQLMECADKALYRVKKHGKNNYMLYTNAI